MITDEAVPKNDEVEATIEMCWLDLIEKDDRTSPVEHPEMALITREELAGYVRAALAAAIPHLGVQAWGMLATDGKTLLIDYTRAVRSPILEFGTGREMVPVRIVEEPK